MEENNDTQPAPTQVQAGSAVLAEQPATQQVDVENLVAPRPQTLISPKKPLVNLSDLSSSATTSYEFKHPYSDKLIGVKISGYTPDSKEWRNFVRQQNDPNEKTSLYIEKGGKQSIELDADAADKRRQLLANVVTNITGLNDWEFSRENVVEIFEDPQYSWMVEQWGEHLDDRKNFYKQPG